MPHRLDARTTGFSADFDRFLALREADEADVDDVVRQIIATVRRDGDAALQAYTARFDRLDLAAVGMRVSDDAIDQAVAGISTEQRDALTVAADRIRAFHERQMPAGFAYRDAANVGLGMRWTPVDRAGLYVPGGTAAYPSSVLMNAIPARVAGVGQVVMTVPTPDGVFNPLVLAAARLAGVDAIFRVGGAQAIAALTYGTATIPAVDKIVGPGNAWVAAAKRMVFGRVGIDMVAGPSEILVVADADNDPSWIAADLLSQAEHDAVAQSILITDDADFADQVAAAADAHLQHLPRADMARTSWTDYGAIIVVADLAADAPALIDAIAPEHLELAVADPDALAAAVTHAGAIFLGRYTPEAVGDYVAGPNHVLPTSQSARFSSGLGVTDFMKRTTMVRCDADSLAQIGPAGVTLAKAEGLDAHALSISLRLPPAGAD